MYTNSSGGSPKKGNLQATTAMEKQQRTLIILILGMLATIGPFSIDMYLPGFPTIAAALNSTVDQVSYTLSSFFIGICIGQLICGPLLDRFGRKIPLMTGLALYILASVGCAFAVSVEMLIVFRFLQALGGCVGMVAPNAIVRDLFPVNESAKIFSMLILILGVSPILAPTAGSYIVAYAGWEWVFVVLAIVTTGALLVVWFKLPESKGPDPSFSLKPLAILRSYRMVLHEPQYVNYALAGSIASAGLFAYLAGSPFVFMKYYQVNEQQYGWIFALIAAGLIASSQLNNLILKKFESAAILRVVMTVQSVAGLLLVTGSLTGWLTITSTILLLCIFLSCQGFTFPNAAALAMAPFSKGAGSAAALMGAFQMACGALASALVGLFFNNTPQPMMAVMSCCSLLGLIILLTGSRRLKYAANPAVAEEEELELLEKF